MSKTYIPVALRKQVFERAKGCCEYCLLPESTTFAPHEIDHIIAEKHHGQTVPDNLALSCSLCNKYKGSDLASIDIDTQTIVPLYHPRQNQWQEHFGISEGEIIALTSIGGVTIRLLQLNRRDRVEERQLLIKAGIITLSI